MNFFHRKEKDKKKKSSKKSIFKWGSRVLLCVFSIVLIFTLPFVGLKSDNFSLIYSKFIGNKSKYQGIIEIWNIDTFESGVISKTSFLTTATKNYQKKNKGIYFMIRNMTEQECLNLLESGESPDLFSCSYGVSNKLLDYIESFQNSSSVNIRDEFYDSGIFNGELYGLAWCRGCYFLISTETRLEKAGVDILADYSLSNIALSLGYQVESKNSTKTIYSLSLGTGKYLLPQLALSAYTNNGADSNNFVYNPSYLGQSSYSAYSRFVAGESVVLLGTQRDVYRMENKVKLGKEVGVVYEALTEFTDLVQFFMVAKNDDSLARQYAEDFAIFVTESETQALLGEAGLFPVTEVKNSSYNLDVMCDIIPQINGSCKVFNVFLSDEEIESLRL